MKELEYPFVPEELIKQKKSLKRKLLENAGTALIEKRIAILGGQTTQDIKLMLELFLLNYGIRPTFMSRSITSTMRTECSPTRSWRRSAPT